MDVGNIVVIMQFACLLSYLHPHSIM